MKRTVRAFPLSRVGFGRRSFSLRRAGLSRSSLRGRHRSAGRAPNARLDAEKRAYSRSVRRNLPAPHIFPNDQTSTGDLIILASASVVTLFWYDGLAAKARILSPA
jgi:hypothetical protein